MDKLNPNELQSLESKHKNYGITNEDSLIVYDTVAHFFTESQKKEGIKGIISSLIKSVPERKELFNKVYYEVYYTNVVMDAVIEANKSCFPKTVVKASPIHGNGVFASQNIKKGTLVTFYPAHYMKESGTGTLYPCNKIILSDLEPNFNLNTYTITGHEKELYDVIGHPQVHENHKNGHIINHSSDSNTYYQLFNGNRDYKCNIWGIISTKDIKKGTELTVDYGPRAEKLLNNAV